MLVNSCVTKSENKYSKVERDRSLIFLYLTLQCLKKHHIRCAVEIHEFENIKKLIAEKSVTSRLKF